MREVNQAFEGHKKGFHQLSGDMQLDLPPPLQKLNVSGKVEEGELNITKYVQAETHFHVQADYFSKNMRQFFDPCVDRVIELIQSQIAQVESKRNRVKVCPSSSHIKDTS